MLVSINKYKVEIGDVDIQNILSKGKSTAKKNKEAFKFSVNNFTNVLKKNPV